MYDIIIAGAGPAGCTAAKTLAESGLRVLLAERFPLPRDKSCSGILIQKALNLVRRRFGEDPPAAVQCKPEENRGMVFTDGQGREYRFEQKGLNVWRSAFDHWLAVKAAESGAELRDRTAILSCENRGDHVAVALRGQRLYSETAKYVLDCEGAADVLKRKLTGCPPDSVMTFQTFNRGNIDLDPHYFYAYLQPELSEYDAWFNVKDGLLALGVAVRNTRNLAAYYGRFLSYMRARHGLRIAEQVWSEKWLMPRIRPGCPVCYGAGRVLFAGEAAGFLNPMGEGISAAIESGECAACAITAHFEEIDGVYGQYRSQTESLKAYMERQWRFVGGMAETFREMKGQRR